MHRQQHMQANTLAVTALHELHELQPAAGARTCTLQAGILLSEMRPPATPMSRAATSLPTAADRLGAMRCMRLSTNLMICARRGCLGVHARARCGKQACVSTVRGVHAVHAAMHVHAHGPASAVHLCGSEKVHAEMLETNKAASCSCARVPRARTCALSSSSCSAMAQPASTLASASGPSGLPVVVVAVTVTTMTDAAGSRSSKST